MLDGHKPNTHNQHKSGKTLLERSSCGLSEG